MNSADLQEVYKRLRSSLVESERQRSLVEAKALADRRLDEPTAPEAVMGGACDVIGIPRERQPEIRDRWIAAGRPLLRDFAPYVRHVVGVDMFFCIAIASDLVSRERASNRADIAYLYYLPFCMVFTSSDHLHASVVPLFLRDYQTFVHGSDLKADLKRLDEHYSKLPEETRARGIRTFASRPPVDGDFLVTRLWDRFLPTWREQVDKAADLSDEVRSALLELVKKAASSPPTSETVTIQEAAFVMTEQKVPRQIGKWRIFPPEVK